MVICPDCKTNLANQSESWKDDECITHLSQVQNWYFKNEIDEK
jgi:uncharacterized protein YbaR (Trm112 family)